MPTSWAETVAILTTIINKLDNVYFTEMWLGQTRYYISILDLLEIIFGVTVMRSLMNHLFNFTGEVNKE